jgi:uncharacterized protein DUF3383
MSININNYVDITSSVGAGTTVPAAELIGRLFTINSLLPTGSYLEFTSATNVGAYFGTASEEYLRATQYFDFINKQGTTANKLSFARWVDADVPPLIFGTKVTTTLGAFQAITTGSLTMDIGGVTNVMTGMDFSATTSLSDVAAVLQLAIRANSGSQWTGATVSWNSVSQAFDFVGGDAVVATISTAATGSGVDMRLLIGWGANAIFSAGDVTETITDTLTNSAALSTNFGSFVFMPTLTIDQHVEAATWCQSRNVQFQYYVPCLLSNYVDWSAALIGIGMCGVIITLGISGQYPEQTPMQIMASTNYNLRNSTQNYMFYEDGLTPSVFDDLTKQALDAAKVNYDGQTQSAGNNISFFQTGVLMGPSNLPPYMNIGANEQWLKATMVSTLMTLLLVLTKISANAQGVGQILTTLQGVINQALFNGVISVGKILSPSQQAFITSITGDTNSWRQVQDIGYLVSCNIDATAGIAYYFLIYSKDDVVRMVNGTQILI